MNTRFFSRPFRFARRLVVTTTLLVVLGLPGVAIGQSASQAAFHTRSAAPVSHVIMAHPKLAYHTHP
ncbi:MAG TPA: hypothetical protein VGT44_04845 [Ktedonobacteraceae bacterium]|nr:hypothetical protein [Ktedonobacteraceae bacterium]